MKEFKQHVEYFLKNKLFMICLVLTAVVGYGYVLFHGTCGIDDVSIDLYFKVGIGVAIGRWPYYLINKIIPIELRRTLDIAEKDALEIYVDGEQIILKKYEPACIFCGDARDVVNYKGKNICKNCMEELKYV